MQNLTELKCVINHTYDRTNTHKAYEWYVSGHCFGRELKFTDFVSLSKKLSGSVHLTKGQLDRVYDIILSKVKANEAFQSTQIVLLYSRPEPQLKEKLWSMLTDVNNCDSQSNYNSACEVFLKSCHNQQEIVSVYFDLWYAVLP